MDAVPNPTQEEFDILTTLLPKGVKWGQSLTPRVMAAIAAAIEKKLRAEPSTEPLLMNSDRYPDDQASISRQAFPEGEFQVFKASPEDPHSAWYLRWPGGALLKFNHCADGAVDRLRAEWACTRLNEALVGGGPGTETFPTQDPKYGIRHDRIINMASGLPIPMDEPVFLFRARDRHAHGTLLSYVRRLNDADHILAVTRRAERYCG